MRVKFLKSLAGADFKYGKGLEIDIPDGKAEYYARLGLCHIMSVDMNEKPIAEEYAPVMTREDYQKFLSMRGIEFDKRWGLKKLKDLADESGMV